MSAEGEGRLGQELAKAVKRGNEAKTRELIARGANPLERESGQTLLIALALSGRDSVGTMNALIEAGCDIDETDSGGRGVLVCAMSSGSVGMASELILRGAGVKGLDDRERTLLHLACAAGKAQGAQLAEELIKAGLDVGARDRRGFTPLHYAAEEGEARLCQALIKAGADVNARTINGNTPLHKAAERGRVEAIEALLSAGAEPMAVNRRASTPLERHREFAESPIRGGSACEAVKARLGSAEEREKLGAFLSELPGPVKKAPKGL